MANEKVRMQINLEEDIASDLKTFCKTTLRRPSSVIQDALKMYLEINIPCQPVIDTEKDTFYDFMTDDNKKVAKISRNALIRHGITTMKQFAEAKPEEFLGFRNIGFAAIGYIVEKQKEARSILGLGNENWNFDYFAAMENYKKKLYTSEKRKIFGGAS